MRCPHCDAVLNDGARFCGRCGQPVGVASPAPRSTEPRPQQTQPQPQSGQYRSPGQPQQPGPYQQPGRPQQPGPLQQPNPLQSQVRPTSQGSRGAIPHAVYVAINAVLVVFVTFVPWMSLSAAALGILSATGLLSGYDYSLPFAGFELLRSVVTVNSVGYGIADSMGSLLGFAAVFGILFIALWAVCMIFLVRAIIRDVRGMEANGLAFIAAVICAVAAAITIVICFALISLTNSQTSQLGLSFSFPITPWCWTSMALAIAAAVFRKRMPTRPGAVMHGRAQCPPRY